MPDAPPSSLAAALRLADRNRYQLALFAPPDRRDALFALYAFNIEIAQIREKVREPMLGMMRLQWWRDALDETYAEKSPRRHAFVEPLAAAIRRHRLSRAHFMSLLAAREQDFAEEPPASLAALEAYAEGSAATLNALALEVLDVADAPAQAAGRSAGIAYALAGLLVATPFHARQRRLWLPQDLVARHRLDVDHSVMALKPSPALSTIAREIAARAQEHLASARREHSRVPRAARPVLLHGTIAAARLRRLERLGFDVMNPQLAAEDTLQSVRLAWAALRDRY